MTVTYLSFGSNLGDREFYLKRGFQGLEEHGIQIVRRASLFETEPKDVTAQPWFINTIVEANTILSPRDLMNVCLDIERANHRTRNVSKAARTLDIDIIFYDASLVHEVDLIIPHPRFAERRFVLVPLAEIAPAFIDPRSGRTVLELLDSCPDASQVHLRSNI